MRRGLLVAIRPRFTSLKNSWFHAADASIARAARLGIIVAGAIFIPHIVYIAIVESLSQFRQSAGAVGYILELIQFTLLSILFFSNCVHALQSLFLSKDNDLLLAAPLQPHRLFAGKFLETLLSSSWVMVIFYLPAMFAIGSVFGANFAFYCITVIDLIPLITIPTCLGFIASILFVRVYPAKRVKELFIGASLLFIILLHFSLRGHELLFTTLQNDLPALLSDPHLLASKKIFNSDSLHLLSVPLESAMSGNIIFSSSITVLLYGIAGLCMLSAYRCFHDLYFKIYSSDTLSLSSVRFRTRRSNSNRRPTLTSAMAFKDYRLFIRDLTQPIQLLLFLAMGLVAVLGLRSSASLGESIRETQRWWDDLVMIFNIALHSLISILFSARFLFPSIAAEGDAAWILRSAPMTTLELLRVKFFVNVIPASIILITLLIAGCIVSDLSIQYTVIAVIAGFLNIYCISGISIGCGAYFSNMRYEHMGQITAGLGSFLFMLIALIIIPWNGFLSLFCALCVALLFEIREAWEISAVALFVLTLLSVITVRYFLRKGQEQLEVN